MPTAGIGVTGSNRSQIGCLPCVAIAMPEMTCAQSPWETSL